MKRIHKLVLFATVLCIHQWLTSLLVIVSAAETITLIGPNKSAPVIVLSDKASKAEKYAAEEMANYLKKISGQKIQVVDDQHDIGNQTAIAIGRSKLTNAIDTSSLGVEQYIIDVQPNKVAIVGGRRSAAPGQSARDAATLYGVYDVLEKLGVRWYRPEPWGEHVPKLDTVNLEIGRKVSPQPSYPVRAAMAGGLTYHKLQTPDEIRSARIWAVRNRTNTDFMAVRDPDFVDSPIEESEQFGGIEDNVRTTHSWPETIPADKFFDSHPEYFALVDGKRVPYDLCAGNTEVQKLFAEKIIADVKANPNLISVSSEPRDCYGGSCQCPLCKAMDQPNNPHSGGESSNRVSAFGKLLADSIAKQAPGIKVQWLAYSSHTGAPTNVKELPPNSIIELCPINGWDDWRKKLFDSSSPQNKSFVQVAKDWLALKPGSLRIFLYFDGYGWPGPIPLTRVIADRAKGYRQLGITGVDLPAVKSWGPMGIDIYMWSRLAWDPDLDVDKELDLYYMNYYGPAAKPMKEYHERFMQALEQAKYSVSSGGRGMYLVCTPQLMKELGKSMNEAQELVKGQPLYERRLKGVWAGYEFARRISDILALKKKTGIATTKIPDAKAISLPADFVRPEFNGDGSYLYSKQAEDAYRDLVSWMRSVNRDDLIFDMKSEYKDDAAVIIYPKRGLDFGADFFSYLPMDVLVNGLHSNVDEKSLLEDF